MWKRSNRNQETVEKWQRSTGTRRQWRYVEKKQQEPGDSGEVEMKQQKPGDSRDVEKKQQEPGHSGEMWKRSNRNQETVM